ncbi:Ribonuclease H-like superfamily [Sesbania bispinosa]|nr:Ribonuclease H-like superfamily [Sesbania bispinosa]
MVRLLVSGQTAGSNQGECGSWHLNRITPWLSGDQISEFSAHMAGWERGLVDPALCPLCLTHVETDAHCIRDCPHVSGIWNMLFGGQMPASQRSTPISMWLFNNIASADVHNSGFRWNLIFGVTCWLVWKSRNEIFFQNAPWDCSNIVHRVLHAIRKFTTIHNNGPAISVHKKCSTKHISWSPPEHGWVKWNLDGSVLAPDARASSGCVLRDSMGRWLTGIVRNIGHSSITFAELWAFKDASYVSLLRGDAAVWFESDSITAVNFVKHGVPPNHPCFGLVSAIRKDLSKIQSVIVSHTFREGNFVADGLADIGHSCPLGLHVLSDPPSSISNFLLADSVCFPRPYFA